MRKKILVTGVSGLVGHGIAKYFLEKGYCVYGTTYKNSLPKDLRKLKIITNFDVTKKESFYKINKIINKFEYVVHSAAIIPSKSKNNKSLFFNTNYEGTKRLLNFSIKNKIKKFIFISTMALANQKNIKNNYYLISKKRAEDYCFKMIKKKITKISVLRIKAPYGFIPGKSVISLFIKRISLGKNLNLFSNGERTQIFTFVNDIAKAIEKIFKKKTFLFGIVGPQIVTMKYLAKLVFMIFKKNNSQKIIFLNRIDAAVNQSFDYKNINLINFNKTKLFTGLKKIKRYNILNKIYDK